MSSSQRTRNVNRSAVKYSDKIAISLQKCHVNNNYILPEHLLAKAVSEKRKRLLSSLLDILAMLLKPEVYQVQVCEPEFLLQCLRGEIKVAHVGMIDYQFALEHFMEMNGFNEGRPDEVKSYFKDTLLHRDNGINCIFYKGHERWSHIVLNTDEVSIVRLLSSFGSSSGEVKLERNLLASALQSMNTEYDKNVLRGVLTSVLSDKEITYLGLSAPKANEAFQIVMTSVEQYGVNKLDAEQCVLGKIEDDCAKLMEEIESLEKMDTELLSQKRKLDFDLQMETLNERLHDLRQLRNHETKYGIQKFNQLLKAVEKSCLQKRKAGAGAPSLIDSECEDFIEDSIESKSSYHGRRHDPILYTNH